MKRGRLTEREACLIVSDIANGLNFLHSKGMSHRYVESMETTCIHMSRHANEWIVCFQFSAI
jgi:serine/threonine protein kinase